MKRREFFFYSFLGLALLFAAGCGGGGTHPKVTLTVNPGTASVQAGATATFTASVGNDSSNKGVTWALSCSQATCGTVSPTSTGSGIAVTYAAPAMPPSSDLPVTIRATSRADSTVAASAQITVLAVTMSVSPTELTVQAGAAAPLTALVANDPTNQGVTWTVSCTQGPCGSVSPTATPSGTATTYTAPADLPASDLQVTVTAVSVTNGSVSSSATVTVPSIGITIDPSAAEVEAGGSTQFKATVVNDSQNKGVTWSVTCSPAPCGTISPITTASGTPIKYTAPATAPEDALSVTVTATSVRNPTVSTSAVVTVPTIAVAVTPDSALIPLNAKHNFSATVDHDPTHKGVNWTLTQGTSPCSPSCGTMSSSSFATTYTSPSALPANPTVTLTATSASDSTKSDAVAITVATGTVKLVPATINFGARVVKQSSAPQTVTLTNTGGSALTVNGITFTGDNPGDFSQTNTCGTSVNTGASCTFSVIFKPEGTGDRSASMAISDSSSDSPQLVSLAGKGFKSCGAQIKETLNKAPVRAAIETRGTAAVPSPTGANTVGTRVMRLVDSRRDDPFLENGTKRELLVRFWYPASLNQACKPAEYTPRAVWSYFSQLMGLPLPLVTTNSCADADVAVGSHPVVLFTHGYTGTFTDYTFLFEDLASRGYVVASVDHTYEATAIQFPDGRFLHSGFGSHLGRKLLEDDAALAFALSVRLEDLKFVAGELEHLNRLTGSPFRGKLDTSKIAVAGHSMGGLAASLMVNRDTLFKAGVIIDVHNGEVPNAVLGSTSTPVLILGSGREQWTDNECKLWSNLHGPRFAVNFKGAEHLTPSDAVWLARNAVKTGTMGPEKAVAALRNYIGVFLDSSLRGEAVDPLLTGPSSEYPDAEVANPGQALCSKVTRVAGVSSKK